MSTRAVGGPVVRRYRRRKTALDLDLNSPPSENREEGTSTQSGHQEAQVGELPQAMSVQPAMIDVEAIDDDVIESSPRAFAEVCLHLSILFGTFYYQP